MKIVVALIIFSIIIIIHELGHFLLAKKNGIAVTEFSLGMGPRLLSHQGKATRYSLKLFPIGGSCIMLGEDELVEDQNSFNKKSVWARMSVVVAGPLFNFILAFIFAIFIVAITGYDPASVTAVKEGSPAAQAGLKTGDVITKIDGSGISVGREIDTYLLFHPLRNEEVSVTYQRDGKSNTVKITPVLNKNYMIGFTYNPESEASEIEQVTKGYPLDEAGLKAGDTITKINEVSIQKSSDLVAFLERSPLDDKPITMTYQREGQEYTASITPKMSESYSMGLGYNNNRNSKELNPLKVIKYSYVEVKYWIQTTVGSLGMMVKGQVSKDDIAGPVGIVDMIGNSYEAGMEAGLLAVFLNLAYMTIMLSANLGIMNLLPLPALDGGRLVFLIIEAVRGKPIDQEKEGMVHLIGLVALMLLMIFVVFNDISRIFGG